MVNCRMGYLAAWKVLEEMITDFRKRGMTVPVDVISDLRSSKTLISVLRADPRRIDTGQKVDGYLRNVESYLVSEGQKRFGMEYVDEWLKRLDEASTSVFEEEETRFVPGLPRAQKWIRIKPSSELPLERIKKLADELRLSCEAQDDGCLLICGEDERVRSFVKKMATKHGLRAEK
jgi:hypothetical protein